MNDYGCTPSKEDATCMDDVRESLPVRPGDNQKIDSEYKRNGHAVYLHLLNPLVGSTMSVFMSTAPQLTGGRKQISVTPNSYN